MKEGKRRGRKQKKGKRRREGLGGRRGEGGGKQPSKSKKFIPSIIMVATDLHQEPSNRT